MSRRILLIANPSAAAGRSRQRWDSLLAALRRSALQTEFAITNHPGHAIELAKQAAPHFNVVVAVGGDGTVHEVASGLLLAGATETALAVVPFGTGNDVALLAGIENTGDALEALAQGQPRAVDAIEVRCQEAGAPSVRYAVLFAAVGFASEVIQRTTPRVKRVCGPRFCYSVGFFRALFSFQSPAMRVVCDGRETSGRLFLACAGNSEFAGGGVMRLSPGAKIDDGLMNISLIDSVGRREIAGQFLRLLKGTHISHPKVRYTTATSLQVESEPSSLITVDGDLVGHTPACFEVKPGALKILTVR